jgi:hypothetical protein
MTEMTPEERRGVHEEQRARLDQNLSATPLKLQKRLSPRAVISGLVALALLAGVGAFGYREYRLHGLKQKLAEAIGRDLGLTETILKLEVDSGKITFGEALALCNRSVEDRTNLIIELRGLYPDLDYQFKTKLIDYLSAENEFVRTRREYYQKTMERTVQEREYSERNKEIDIDIARMKAVPALATEASKSYLEDRINQNRDVTIKALREEEQSADEFLAMYDKMEKLEKAMDNDARAAGLQFDTVFQKNAASTLALRRTIKN